jgi:hypothetical protein
MRIFSGFFAFRSWAKRTGDAFKALSVELINPDAISINADARLLTLSVDGTEVFGVNAAGQQVVGSGAVLAPVSLTTATPTLSAAAHSGRIITLNRATGVAVTLPAATGSGATYHFIVGTTFSGGSFVATCTGDDTLKGLALGLDGDGVPANAWAAGASDEIFTMDGSTQGGVVGDEVIFRDIKADIYAVQARLQQSGTEASPFSSAA